MSFRPALDALFGVLLHLAAQENRGCLQTGCPPFGSGIVEMERGYETQPFRGKWTRLRPWCYTETGSTTTVAMSGLS